MDTFCILRGTLLDNPSVKTLLNPEKHSLHCLIDPQECIANGYELLTAPPNGQTEYTRAAKFDAKGNDMIVALAKSLGKGCRGCTGSQLQGFRATVKGKINRTTTPFSLEVTEVLPDTVACPKPAFCFSGETTVNVKSNGTVSMKDLQLGDEVLVAQGTYEKVYSFGHRHESIEADFLQFLPSGLEISEEHMVKMGDRHVPAYAVQVGDQLESASGELITVEEIKTVVRKGVYAPFTMSGTIVVSNVKASSYVSFQESETLVIGGVATPVGYQWIAHLSQAPRRLYARVFGVVTDEQYIPESGMSSRVQGPLDAWEWYLGQNAIVMVVLLVPAVLCLMVFSTIDAFLALVLS